MGLSVHIKKSEQITPNILARGPRLLQRYMYLKNNVYNLTFVKNVCMIFDLQFYLLDTTKYKFGEYELCTYDNKSVAKHQSKWQFLSTVAVTATKLYLIKMGL